METWSIEYDDWDPTEEKLREALCTLGNGYFATRGASEESHAGEVHYPGTYLAGGYNRYQTVVSGEEIENEDLVNWPDWTCLSFRHEGDEWFDLANVHIETFLQKLDMKRGELLRKINFRDRRGRESRLETARIVSMDNLHLAALRWKITPLNWSGTLEFRSHIDGSVINAGVARYRDLPGKHLVISKKFRESHNIQLIEVHTNQSEITMSQAVKTCFKRNGNLFEPTAINWEEEEIIGTTYSVECKKNEEVTVEKTLALFTSQDKAIFHPTYEAIRLIRETPEYDVLHEKHMIQWDRLWDLCDIRLPKRSRETKLLRFHIFHLLQTVSLKSSDLDVGVPSRGLHGEAYRGHIFWDEIYILPFLNLRVPELARSLLMYRYRRLPEARLAASKEGLKGAMFPWQSGSNGEEESQVIHLNPKSGRWISDNTYKQRHINSTIVYNIWRYYQATHDKEFMSMFGVEIALEISRFWISILEYSQEKDRFEIKGVVGPDEFHTKYPYRDSPGIDNNTYTNFMAAWCIKSTLEMFDSLGKGHQKDLLKVLGISKDELEDWEKKSKRIYLPILEDGLLDQFEGFHLLKDLDWDAYRNRYGNIQRIDRILEAENDDVNFYKVNKQADVLMLYYLFSCEELRECYRWLGYEFEPESIKKNINYHLALSSNGSSLSRIVHSWVLSRSEHLRSWIWFNQALESDIADIQGGTTAEGIHLGAMAGTVDLIQRCYTGLEVSRDVLWIKPHFPDEIEELNMKIRFRGHFLSFVLKDEKLCVRVEHGLVPEGKIGFGNKVHVFRQGDVFYIPIVRESEGVSVLERKLGVGDGQGSVPQTHKRKRFGFTAPGENAQDPSPA